MVNQLIVTFEIYLHISASFLSLDVQVMNFSHRITTFCAIRFQCAICDLCVDFNSWP